MCHVPYKISKVCTYIDHLQSINNTCHPKPINPPAPPARQSSRHIHPKLSTSTLHCIRVHLRLRLSSACSSTTSRYRPLACNRPLRLYCASTTSTVRYNFDTPSTTTNSRSYTCASCKHSPKSSYPPQNVTTRESPGHPPLRPRKKNHNTSDKSYLKLLSSCILFCASIVFH